MLKKIIGLLVVGFLLIACAFYFFVQSTMLSPGGTHRLRGLTAAVTVEEDAAGVPTLSGATLPDLMRGQGWILARDRLFQMDLIRRRAAGRLAEVFGAGALPSDRLHRVYGFNSLAEKIVAGLQPDSRDLMAAFASGVNDFIAGGTLPLEMRALGLHPEPWTPADSVLIALSMFEPPSSERAAALASARFSDEGLRILGSSWGFFDAPIIADPIPNASPKVENWKALLPHAASALATPPPTARIVDGSNAWALAASRTGTGKPILAGDPHLQLGMPNVWYRLKLKLPDWSVTGVALPGVPGVLLGTNGHVAWTLTNGMTDAVDHVVIAPADDAAHYLVDGKPVAYTIRTETIAIKDAPPKVEKFRDTIWGPVINENGRDFVLQWVALDASLFRRGEMTMLDRAPNLDAALAALREWCGPVHNVILATDDGHIAWTIAGHTPRRVGFDGKFSTVRDRTHYWNGYLPLSEYPRVIDPPEGFIVSANQRPVPLGQHPERLSNDWPSPARAYRIRDEIAKRHDWTADSSYRLQLDVFSVVDDWYRRQLLGVIPTDTRDAWLAAIATLARDWDGKLSVDSAGYVFVQRFRAALFHLVIGGAVDSLKDEDERKALREFLERDEWMAVVLKERPAVLIEGRFADWDEALRGTAVEVAKKLAKTPDGLRALRWGNFNRAEVRHPFSIVLPKFLWGLVNLPEVPLPGGTLVPREGNPSHAASMRMVIDLAAPERSIFNQPGGQSGAIFSPHYRDLFPSWLDGTPLAFEPTATKVVTHLVNQ